MIQRSTWWSIVSTSLVVVALSCGAAGAADRTKVDAATQRVEEGARQIGRGDIGDGFKEMFTGVGFTIVEGAKFSGQTIADFFRKTFAS